MLERGAHGASSDAGRVRTRRGLAEMSGMNERTALLGGKEDGKEEEEKEEKLAEVELGPNGLWETAKERRQRKYVPRGL